MADLVEYKAFLELQANGFKLDTPEEKKKELQDRKKKARESLQRWVEADKLANKHQKRKKK